jgi:protein-tyrosine phosphatase
MSQDSTFKLLYVCNGNNARSPLAAAFTYQRVTRVPGEVRWHISSAGTTATDGAGVRPEVQRAASSVNLDLSEHSTQALTAEACESPDLILGMAWDQVSDIWSLVPQAWGKVFTIKEFIHWAKQAPARPPILFSDRIEHMRDKVTQAHAIRKRARADHGFWGGLRPGELNLIEPEGHGDEAWTALVNAVQALTNDVITLLSVDGGHSGV